MLFVFLNGKILSMFSLKSFTFNIAAENTYLLFNENKKAWLIDPGNGNDQETSVLADFIKEHQLDVIKIILTHAHFDHVLGLQWAFDTFKVPVVLHADEQEILDLLPMSAHRFGILVPAVQVETVYVKEGDVVDFEGNEFRIYHVPGHSPGSVVYYQEKEKFLIAGDVLFQGSIGRTDLYKGDYDLLISGIKTKLLTLPEDTRVFPGHGSPTNIGFEKQFNPFLK